MSRAYIGRIGEQGLDAGDVIQALEWLQWENIVPAGARVFIKPNLTWPEHMPGVTTTPQAIEAVVAALGGRTSHITIGESDGGYHSFQAEEAFRGHRLYELAERYGVRAVNLSKEPVDKVTITVAGRRVMVTLPRLLLYETDVFVTMPVPKVHVMTGVSLAFKNQWGCLPSTMRLREHPQFDHKILAINRLLKPRLAVFDGSHFLDRTGPLHGEPVRMNLLIVSDDIGAASAVCCALMGIDPAAIRHFRLAQQEGMFPDSLEQVAVNTPLESLLGHHFTMKRAFLDWLSLLGFRNGAFARLFWDSAAAGPLHTLLYAVRRSQVVNRLLYGPTGSPPEWTAQAGHT